MAEVKWIKITTDIFDDEKILLIESMPDADAVIVIWFKLLCLAGKMNNSGVFLLNHRIAYTEEMLATIFRRPVNTVRMALSQFEQFGMIEIVDGVITIPNWGKHQSLDRLEKNKEYHKNYMREQRAQQKALCEVNNEVNSEVNSEVNVNTIEEEKNKKKNKKENKKENKNTVDIFSDFANGNQALLDALNDFVLMRKKIKKPMTDRAKELLLSDLQKLSVDQDEQVKILYQSVYHSWAGVYGLKGEPASGKESTMDIIKELHDEYSQEVAYYDEATNF